ncbi:MAG: glycosyltransferase [Rikenellaceae bacterium]
MYKHYLITRFNIIQEGFNIPADKDRKIVHSESWLSRRFELFETYTIPSIENQTCDDFTWLVLFDTNTPAKYKELIDSYRQKLPLFTPLYLDAFVNLNEHVSDYIRKTSTKEYVITSRIDNDDMIHRDYIKRVQ